MKIDLRIDGWFTLNVADEDSADEQIEKIQNETIASLSRIALKYNLGISNVELIEE